jgi:tetratricopeptide (TPR) repeat protein
MSLEYSQRELRSFVAALGDEQRTAIGAVDRWSAKDVVAHITEWIARRVSELEHATRSADRPPGALPDDDDLDETNAEIYTKYQGVSWEQILVQMEQSFDAIIAFARAATPFELDDTRFIPWLAERPLWRILVGNAVEHPILHLGYYHITNGNSTGAVRLQEACVTHLLELNASPAWRGAQVYNLACIEALSGRKEKALANLAEAFRLVPDLVEWSKQDPDLTGLRQDPAFQALYAV